MNLFALNPVELQNQVSNAQINPLQPQDMQAGFFQGMGSGISGGLQSFVYRDRFNVADATHDEESRARALDALESVRPNPAAVGTMGQLLFGLGDTLGTVWAAFAGGNITPQTMAQSAGVSYAKSQAALHVREGIDPATAESAGKIEGAALGLGVVTPASITGTLLQRTMSGAAINGVMGMSQRGLVSKVLSDAGYAQQAEQYKIFDAAGVMTDLALGGFFGGVFGPRAPKELAGLPKPKPSDVDAALTMNNAGHIETGTAPGIPTDAATQQAHVTSLVNTLEDLLMGREPRPPEDGAVNGNFTANPAADAARADVLSAVRDHMGPEWEQHLNAELEKRGLPTDPTLYDIASPNGERAPVRFTDNVSAMIKEWEATGDTGLLLTRLRGLEGKLEVRAADNAAKADNDLVRGELWVRERLMRAERTNEITPEAHALAKWMLDKNPGIANDLALSFKKNGNGAAGSYNPAQRLATLFKSSQKDTTVAHEILHHTERMMPEAVRQGIRDEWIRQLERLQRTAAETQNHQLLQAIDDAIRSAAGDGDAFNRLAEQIKSGELPYHFYQYVNPSEFWAVNAERLVSERANAGGWVGQAVQWLKEFIEKAKSVFGFSNDAAVIKGLDAVLKGDGTLSGRMIGEGQLFQDVLRAKRTVAQLVKDAESQISWKDWYRRHETALQDLFGTDADLFQKLLSVTSQAASVKANVGLAVKAYRQLMAGEPFEGYLPAVIKNLERVRDEQAIQGQKIGEYAKANDGAAEGIAVDRHIAQLLFGVDRPTPAQVALAKKRIIAVAEQLGWEPREVQAALWAFNQVRNGVDPAKVVSYDTVLLGKTQQISEIRAQFGRAEEGGISPGGRPAAENAGTGSNAGRAAEAGAVRPELAAAQERLTNLRTQQDAIAGQTGKKARIQAQDLNNEILDLERSIADMEREPVESNSGPAKPADPFSVEAIAQENPGLQVPLEDGTVVSATDALARADAEIAQAKLDSQGYEAAAACALRG